MLNNNDNMKLYDTHINRLIYTNLYMFTFNA